MNIQQINIGTRLEIQHYYFMSMFTYRIAYYPLFEDFGEANQISRGFSVDMTTPLVVRAGFQVSACYEVNMIQIFQS